MKLAPHRLWKPLAVAGVLALAGGGAWLWWSSDRSAAAIEYRTATVDRGAIVSQVSATGTVNAVGVVAINTQVNGEVAQVLVDFNSPVTAGQVMARLNPETFQMRALQADADLAIAQANLASAQASVVRAQSDLRNGDAQMQSLQAQLANAQAAVDADLRDLERQTELFNQQIIAVTALQTAQTKANASKSQLDQIKANIAGQQATLDGRKASLSMAQAGIATAQATIQQKQAAFGEAKADLGRTEIRAPADGVVLSRTVEVGQTVRNDVTATGGTNTGGATTTALFTTAHGLDEMEVAVSIDEADIARILPGQRVTFTVDGQPGRTFAGRVTQVRLAPRTVQNVVTYTVVARAENADHALLPGMTATATIVLSQLDNALRIPNTALRYTPAGFQAPATTTPAPAEGRNARVFALGADGRPQLVPVVIGATDGRFTQVLSGQLAPGQAVIIGSNEAAVGATATPVAGIGGPGPGGGFFGF